MSKVLKKLIDINRLREFKNKLVGAGSAYVQTGAVDQTIAGTKTFSKPIVGSVTGSSGSCTGNAASATKLQTARTINGTSFNGTANITTTNWGTARNISITDGTNTSTAVSVNGSANVSLKLPATIKANLTGNAATATKLAAKRTIALSGAATGTATGFDGSGNITIPVTKHTYLIRNIKDTYQTKEDLSSQITTSVRSNWYSNFPDGAEAHNAMWGGRDITASFNNGTVSANIANGTFRDIFPGDYITKQVTISGKKYTVNWVIADCDYWINKGDTAVTVHHVAIVPQAPIFDANMNATNTTEGGYMGSRMFKETIPACATGIVNAFGASHILTFRDYLIYGMAANQISSGLPNFTGGAQWGGSPWVSVQCDLMTEKMVLGAPVNSASALDEWCATRQMSAFRLSENLINYNRQWYWLRNIVSSAHFACVSGHGRAYTYDASHSGGVRPFALLV